MHVLQLLALGVALAHAGLLAGVYFDSSIKSHAFVSTEVHGAVFFRTLLTCIIVFEHLACACYLYLQAGSSLRIAAAVTAVCLATAGWLVLASFPSEETWHFLGAGLFIAATALYSFLLIARAQRLRGLLFFAGACTLSLALGFLILYFLAEYQAAATLEWVAFLLDAALLCVFFACNPPEPPPQKKIPQHTEVTMPLIQREQQQY